MIIIYYYGKSVTDGYHCRGMRVDLTARFDYATGWSYLFIVDCRYIYMVVLVNLVALVMQRHSS